MRPPGIIKIAVVFLILSDCYAQTSFNGTLWRLEELNHSLTNIPCYALRFSSDTMADFRMAINAGYYKVKADSVNIKFTLSAITLIVLSGREPEFLAAMDSVVQWKAAGRRLFLMSSTDTVMKYIDQSALCLCGQSWQLQSIWQKSKKPQSGRTVITEPDRYAAKFDSQRSLQIRSDCNTCGGTYSSTAIDFSSGTISVTLAGCTKVDCGPDSKDSLFTAVLGETTGYLRSNDTLFCFANPDTLVFMPAPVGAYQTRPGSRILTPSRQYSISIKNQKINIDYLNKTVETMRLLNNKGVVLRSITGMSGMAIRGISMGTYVLAIRFFDGAGLNVPVAIVK